MKIREVIQHIEREGWFMVVMKDQARQYKHPSLKGRITLAGGLDAELSPAAVAMIGLQSQPRG
jgi:predicted RNA binding protein YcfA (HicA-like mRNA interferase family)